MNKELSNDIIVLELANPRITLININDNFKKELFNLGFNKENKKFIITINLNDIDQKALLIKELIVLGSLFQDGKDWSPSEIVEYFRDDLKKIHGKFKMISWLNENQYVIRSQ